MKRKCDIEAVFRRHFSMVYRLCYSYLGSAADAEDAAQSVFVKLVNNPRAFENEDHERAWLLTCSANHCKDVLKSAPRTRVIALPSYESSRMGTHDGVDETLEAMSHLPLRYKECLYLYYYEGYKTAEIAQMLGIPSSTVRNRLRDARQTLRGLLEDNTTKGGKR